VLIHRGKILRQVVDKYCDMNKTSITALTHSVGYNQSTIYRHFEKTDLAYHIILKYGKAMRHDFSKEFPDIAESLDMVNEPDIEYGSIDLPTCKKQLEHWQHKYISLLEKHNELLMEKLQSNGNG
jgi:AcrR family transcriptional regulator